jgi:hypothetical protein
VRLKIQNESQKAQRFGPRISISKSKSFSGPWIYDSGLLILLDFVNLFIYYKANFKDLDDLKIKRAPVFHRVSLSTGSATHGDF